MYNYWTNKFNKYLVLTLGNKVFYKLIEWKVDIRESIFKNVDNTYLFLLAPPYCGSTVFNQIISTSSHVSVNNVLWSREGQQLPELKETLFHENRFDDSISYDWNHIKNVWNKYWDHTKPILLEKSPPNIVRTQQLVDNFSPARFIVFTRNPYANAESLIRRHNRSVASVIAPVIRNLHFQRLNVKKLNSDYTYYTSYEELTENTDKVLQNLVEFIPELNDINPDTTFTADNPTGTDKKLKNFNPQKLKNLHRDQLIELSEAFKEHKELLSFFNYKILNEEEIEYLSDT